MDKAGEKPKADFTIENLFPTGLDGMINEITWLLRIRAMLIQSKGDWMKDMVPVLVSIMVPEPFAVVVAQIEKLCFERNDNRGKMTIEMFFTEAVNNGVSNMLYQVKTDKELKGIVEEIIDRLEQMIEMSGGTDEFIEALHKIIERETKDKPTRGIQ